MRLARDVRPPHAGDDPCRSGSELARVGSVTGEPIRAPDRASDRLGFWRQRVRAHVGCSAAHRDRPGGRRPRRNAVDRGHALGRRQHDGTHRGRGTGFASAEEIALQEAVATGEPVVVEDLTTETVQVTALPEGLFEASVSPAPVRIEDDGQWRELDATLRVVA